MTSQREEGAVEKVLGQAEIDKLFAAAAKQQELEAAPVPVAVRVEAYNFGLRGIFRMNRCGRLLR